MLSTQWVAVMRLLDYHPYFVSLLFAVLLSYILLHFYYLYNYIIQVYRYSFSILTLIEELEEL